MTPQCHTRVNPPSLRPPCTTSALQPRATLYLVVPDWWRNYQFTRLIFGAFVLYAVQSVIRHRLTVYSSLGMSAVGVQPQFINTLLSIVPVVRLTTSGYHRYHQLTPQGPYPSRPHLARVRDPHPRSRSFSCSVQCPSPPSAAQNKGEKRGDS